MFSSITSFTLFFFLPMCIAILLGILFEEKLIAFEQHILRALAKRHRNRAHVHMLRAEAQTKTANKFDR